MDVEKRIIPLSSKKGEWFVPPELRDRLVADAKEKGSNMTDVILQILGQRYGIVVESNGRKTSGHADPKKPILINVPLKLDRAVSKAALTNRHTFQSEVRSALCAHYGLQPLPPPRRGRTPSASAVAA